MLGNWRERWFGRPRGVLGWVERVAGWWFGIWCLVGVFVLAWHLEVPFGGLSDFVFIALAAVLVACDTVRTAGLRRGAALLGITALISAVVETIGTKTGLPFGRYIYTDAFGPRIGPLPLAIPLAWIVIVLPLLRIACRAGGGRFLLLIGVPLATVAVDLLLEPVAWDRRGYWIWLEPTGFWYGVPELNFFGWFATSLLILLASLPLLDLPTRQRLARPAPLSVIVLASVVGIFSLTATVSGYLAASILGFILLGLLLLSLRLKKRLKN